MGDVRAIRQALRNVLDQVPPDVLAVEWRLVGTASSTLRGIPVRAGDIDILFRARVDLERFGHAVAGMAGAVMHMGPTHLAGAHQYFAAYQVDGVRIELSTLEAVMAAEVDTVECVGRGPWEHFDLVAIGSHQVPAVSGELRLLTELARGRADRSRPILEHMGTVPCDVALVRRGLDRLDLTAEEKAVVLRRLG